MPEVAARIPKGAAVVEFGAGSATKTPILLEAIAPGRLRPGRHLRRLSRGQRGRGRRRAFPALPVYPGDGRLHAAVRASRSRRRRCPSSASSPARRSAISSRAARPICCASSARCSGAGAQLLIGMDRVKPVERLIAAYDDPEGVTAAVQPQPARRGSTASWTATFRSTPSATRRAGTTSCRGSRCIWSPCATSSSRSPASASASPQGSSIHTENSHKYGQRGARLLLLAGGWTPIAEWSDPAGDFSRSPRRGRARPLRAVIARRCGHG